MTNPPADILSIHERAKALLKRFYGYDSFRPGQLDIISAVASGRDALVLMPTGGGKSICYQLPALLSEGCAVVVSPLIALMHDQVSALVANGIPAAAVNSTLSDTSNREVMELMHSRRLKLLYISPERLMQEIDRWSPDMPISLFAIDEAHCISQWGHDFRPVYTTLSRLKHRYPSVPMMALTATADRLTRADIATQLSLRSPFTYIGSFDRPNLSLRVIPSPAKSEKLRFICRTIDRFALDSGIVYCISRKAAETMHKDLTDRGYRSVCYHAGMSAAERQRSQRAFSNGDAQVVCATVAFGMGIDKSNIRWVIHSNLPPNIESYYQEIGRAGRDGLPAETTLFYSFADIATRQSFIEESGQPMLNLQKLTRMKEYAESRICRRRILLSYFGEEATCDCGNCDVCINPPERFDGLRLVQMALSAIVRTGQKAGLNMIIDILRGSARAEVIARGYHQLKTYGVGRSLSFAEWNAYLSQMLQLGLIEIAYEENNHLRVTPLGMKALYSKIPVELSRWEPIAGRRPEKNASTGQSVRSRRSTVISALKSVRKRVADAEGVPAYIVIGDAGIEDMADKMPVTPQEFASIHGIGRKKLERYWLPFVNAIRQMKGLAPFKPKNG